MLTTENTTQTMKIYWANLCILNRMEGEKMEDAAAAWVTGRAAGGTGIRPEMIYLGDTEETGMYEQLKTDMESGPLGFDIIVSSRFDVFCSGKYLQRFKTDLLPLRQHFALRSEIEKLGVADPDGLFHPLVVLPHFIVANIKLLSSEEIPGSLEELLHPRWEGKVFIGSTELPSAKSVLFSIWHLFGDGGLETAAKNWRQKSAPSAARHGLVKDEFPIALLPGVFGGPGPEDKIRQIVPAEGATVLPSFAAIRRSENEAKALDFLKHSAATNEFIEFYRAQAHAYPTAPSLLPPENISDGIKMIFPSWEWILKQDMDYFEDVCARVPTG